MHNLVYFLIGGLLIGALAFGAVSNNQNKNTNSSSNQKFSDITETDTTDYNDTTKSLQLKTFDLGTVNVAGGSCTPGGKVAYNFLLDTSSSMTTAKDGRFPDMKKDVVAFISKLQPDSVVSVQAFDNGPREVVTPTFFKDIDSKYAGKINSLQPTNSTAGTNTSSGLAGAKKVIDANKAKFPGYNWSLVLVTDGCPNSVDGPMGLNIANQIRASGISLTGYGIKLGTAGKCENLAKKLGLPTGTKPIEAAKVLMEKITGSKDNYSLTETEDLASFLGKVSGKICSTPQASTAPPTGDINFNHPYLDWDDVQKAFSKAKKNGQSADLSPSCAAELCKAIQVEVKDRNSLCYRNESCIKNGYDHYPGTLPSYTPPAACVQEISTLFYKHINFASAEELEDLRNPNCDKSDGMCKGEDVHIGEDEDEDGECG